MAKFDLKFSNIVKVVLVILLVVGLYNLVYNSNVFNYSMYEGFTSDQDETSIFKNAIDTYSLAATIAEYATKNMSMSSLDLTTVTAAKDFINIADGNIMKVNKLQDATPFDDKMTKLITEIMTLSEKTKTDAKIALETLQKYENDLVKDIKTYRSASDSTRKTEKTDLVALYEKAMKVSKSAASNARIVYDKLNILKELYDEIHSKEGFDNLYPSNNDQSINCSLMQPYASYKCGPINPEKSFFDNIDFKPECCPSTYSSSQGCACLCPQQINYLNSRGGNRTFPTQF